MSYSSYERRFFTHFNDHRLEEFMHRMLNRHLCSTKYYNPEGKLLEGPRPWTEPFTMNVHHRFNFATIDHRDSCSRSFKIGVFEDQFKGHVWIVPLLGTSQIGLRYKKSPFVDFGCYSCFKIPDWKGPGYTHTEKKYTEKQFAIKMSGLITGELRLITDEWAIHIGATDPKRYANVTSDKLQDSNDGMVWVWRQYDYLDEYGALKYGWHTPDESYYLP